MRDVNEIRWLAQRFKRVWAMQFWGHLLGLGGSLLVLVDPLIVKWLFDSVLASGRWQGLPIVALLIVGSYGGRVVLSSLGSLLSFRGVVRLSVALRMELFDRLQRQSTSYYEQVQVGDLLFRMEGDVEQVSRLSVEGLADLVRVISTGGLGLLVMGWLNPRLTVLVVPLIPLFVWTTWYFRRHLVKLSDEVQGVKGNLNGFLQEHLSRILEVQLLCREELEARRFGALLSRFTDAEVVRRRVELVFGGVMWLVVVLGIAGVLSYGGYLVIEGELSVGGLVAFYGYVLLLFGPFYGVADLYSRWQRVLSSVRRLQELQALKFELPEAAGAVHLACVGGCAVEVSGISFRYADGTKALDTVDVAFGAGERVGLVGENASGKSTLAKLIARIYDVESGSVKVSGVDVREVKLRSLRRTIRYVGPDPMLRDATLLENILDGDVEAGDDVVREVAKLVRLEEVVARQELGWDEPLGPRTRLSSGEQQRVALGRAVLARPKVLILDECLSAVDEGTEKLIMESLREELGTTTIIFISHRRYLYEWADRIVEMRFGHLLEHGVGERIELLVGS